MDFNLDVAYAQHLDQQDDLKKFRDRFVIDDPDLIYLDGNSLGRLPKVTRDRLHQAIDEEWGQQLIRGWNQGWMEINERVGDKIAQLIGAQSGEVAIADSTSVNLFKLAYAALEANPDRNKIVTDDLNFPSDHYILQGLCKLLDRPIEIHVAKSTDGIHGPVDELESLIDENTALVTLSHTVFKTSYTYDMAAITAMADRVGALTVWDISHSVGSAMVELNKSNAPMAVGCTYKHLNGGPGAPAFLYVRKDLQSKLNNPISGWMGHRDVFKFDLRYDADTNIRQFMTGTPFVLSITSIEPAIDMFIEAGMDRIRQKSMQQSEYFIALWREWLEPFGFNLNAPLDVNWRGSHLSLGHEDGLRIDQSLIYDMKVIPDFRPPDNIRFGFTPLYTTFEEVYEGAKRLQEVMSKKLFENYNDVPLVT